MRVSIVIALALAAVAVSAPADAGKKKKKKKYAKTDCVGCHKADNPGLVRPWAKSAHKRLGVGCTGNG